MLFSNCSKRLYTTKVAVDAQCIPLKPTWSIQSLLEPLGEPISDKQFKHLLALSRLSPPTQEKTDKLKSEIDRLSQFTAHIKLHDFKGVEPLTHIWKEDVGQILRSDDEVETLDEPRGRELLKHAQQKSGNFYVVKATLPSSD